jgi:hypothetical protein
MIAACFNAMDIEWRAERWIAAAIWSMCFCIRLNKLTNMSHQQWKTRDLVEEFRFSS